MHDLLIELRRRNVFRVAGAYGVVAWLLSQVSVTLETALELPNWFDSVIVSLLLIGFPIALLLAWAFEITPEGVKRTDTGDPGSAGAAAAPRALDYVLIGGLAVVACLIVWQMTTSNGTAGDSDTLAESSMEAIVREQSIAVLPFENFSSDPDQDYFASGISEELLNALARTEGLKVSSRTSAFAFKGSDTPIAEIAEALSVAHVLEGSVRKSGTTLRISAQLIDADTDESLWAESYDRALTADNIFAIQDEITRAIVAELQGRMGINVETADVSRTTSIEAYQLYLRARDNMNQRLPETLDDAESLYQQVIELDPDFAPAIAGLAETYLLMTAYAGLEGRDAIDRAQPLVERALSLAPDSAEVLTTAASLALERGDRDNTAAFAERALEANPNYSLAYHRLGLVSNSEGDYQTAIDMWNNALQLDPLSAVILSNLSVSQRNLGDIEASRKTCLDNIRWNPRSPFGYHDLGVLSLLEGDYTSAHSWLMDALARNPKQTDVRGRLASLYTEVGLKERGLSLSSTPSERALAYAYADDFDSAFARFDSLDDFMKGRILMMSGDTEAGMALAEPILLAVFPGDVPTGPDLASTTGLFALVFKELGDDRGDVYRSAIEDYLGGRGPEDFTHRWDLVAGAMARFYDDDPEGAIAWLNRRLELGLADVELNVRPLKDYLIGPAFAPILARNDEILAGHRAAILAQLADPKPDWVRPDVAAD